MDAVPRILNPLSKPPGGGGAKHIACSVRQNRTIRENTRMLISYEVMSSCLRTCCAEVLWRCALLRYFLVMCQMCIRCQIDWKIFNVRGLEILGTENNEKPFYLFNVSLTSY